ncbi:hypothetical protein M2480_001366 [Parabacteroides sp. PFB2-12]|uniref:glycosyltransferase family 10 domain-containing protein n=1 Tax=unclassified Parabacteroides TaxID=2649774 RepID=UPI0024742628|nr:MULTISPECIES: glycosyltransferase family 10 [unclassified Parabacteroides]MDH6343377.1 hypothetical protein [Parabacteroides sp. PM6-13]MDH6390393.1 hypothetical protein [Parabacteroides sp. PFB2-12]
MTKKTIKINFVDFWKGFDPHNNFLLDSLSLHYNPVIDPNPDYLFYSLFGYSHLKYTEAIKIYYTGENDIPDFNFCDYAIGFQHMQFEDRYLRLPLYTLYPGFQRLKCKTLEEGLSKRKFCNFVYSNSIYAIPLREQFYHQLSKYKKIDSGGRFMNNIGGPVADKIAFIKDYKFTIAFENSSLSGYTTEKLMEPMRVNSLPIYWGNPSVNRDFNSSSFICLQDYASIEEAIEEIIRLDNDEEAYMKRLSEPWLTKLQAEKDWDSELSDFLVSIVEQSLNQARRTTMYGYALIRKYRESRLAKYSTLPVIRNLLNK